MPRLLTEEELKKTLGHNILQGAKDVALLLEAQDSKTHLETAREIYEQVDCCFWDLGRYDPELFDPADLMKCVQSSIKQYQVAKSRYLTEGK